MTLKILCCSAVLVLGVSGCVNSAPPAPDAGWGRRLAQPAGPPLTIGRGLGSEFGNYPALTAGETAGPSGEACTVFDWDRPLSQTLALRLRSASCGQPGQMVSTELSRTVIPLSSSPLQTELARSPRL